MLVKVTMKKVQKSFFIKESYLKLFVSKNKCNCNSKENVIFLHN